MSFVTSALAMAGLVAMSVPIIIHLLSRRRRKPIEWAAMRFLLEAYRKHRRRLQIEQLLLLLLRCAILALLGVALARPILNDAPLTSGGSRVVYLLVDNSLISSLEVSQDETALDRHRQVAKKIVEELGPGDAVGVITLAQPVTALLTPPSTDHAGVNELLDELKSTQSRADVQGALRTLRDALEEQETTIDRPVVYMLSEFRQGTAGTDDPLPQLFADIEESVSLIASPPATDVIANTQIVEIEPARRFIAPGAGDDTVQVSVRLSRHGGMLPQDVDRVMLLGEGRESLGERVVQWQQGQAEATVDFLVQPETASVNETAMAARIDHDALPIDNQRFTTIELRQRISVLLVERRSFGMARSLEDLTAGQWMRLSLSPRDEESIEFIQTDPATLSDVDVRGADIVIVSSPHQLVDAGWQTLRSFVGRGGLVIITPPSSQTVHPWTQAMTDGLDLPWRIKMEVDLYESPMPVAREQPSTELLRMIDAELPELTDQVVVSQLLPVNEEQTSAEVILRLNDQTPLLIAGAPQLDEEGSGDQSAGLVVYLAVSPGLNEWTNLPVQPLMVPLMQELTRQGLSLVRVNNESFVGDTYLSLKRSAAQLIDPDDQPLMLNANGQPTEPLAMSGMYDVLDAGQQLISKRAVNVDISAGRTETVDSASVVSWLKGSGAWTLFDNVQPTTALLSGDTALPIGRNLLFALLTLLAVETAIARWFSHARTGRSAALTTIGLRTSMAEAQHDLGNVR